jgi:hypothetical protein
MNKWALRAKCEHRKRDLFRDVRVFRDPPFFSSLKRRKPTTMPDLNALMKQAQVMQEKLQAAQEKLAATEVEGSASGGMVTLTIRGNGELTRVTITPSLMGEDADLVADLIVAAHADAKKKLDAVQQDLMRDAAGPMAGKIPGLGF